MSVFSNDRRVRPNVGLRSMKLVLAFLLSTGLGACSRNAVVSEPVAEPGGQFVGQSAVRVQNMMGRDLGSVTVGTNSFGAVKSGATTPYQPVGTVYENVSVFTAETNGYMRNDRFIGGRNAELPRGRYTYILSVCLLDKDIKVTLKQE
jgi:hypothetical protein